MDSKNFFAVQLKYLKFAGIRTEFPLGWKGILWKIFLVVNILSNIFWATTEGTYFITHLSDLENNADTISNFITTGYGLMELITFALAINDFDVLTTQLDLITRDGKFL